MKPERCRYAASTLPMIQCALDEGHEGEHVTIKGVAATPQQPTEPVEGGEGEVPAEDSLLPCPFCDGEPYRFSSLPDDGEEVAFYVACTKCDARTGHLAGICDTESQSIIAWNTRALSASTVAQPDDVQRLEVLMQHPDKLFVDGSGDTRMYCGANDGTSGRGIWHDDPRLAVDDIIRRLKGETMRTGIEQIVAERQRPVVRTRPSISDQAQRAEPDVYDCPDFKLPAHFSFNPGNLAEQREITEQEWLHRRKCPRCKPVRRVQEQVQPLGGCLCQRCGSRYKVDINIPDDLWDRICGNENLLCGPCITGSIDLLGQFDYFDLVKRESQL